jgi:hypothetical protein
MQTSAATVDGKRAAIENGAIVLPASAKTVDISWTRRADAPELSYQAAVDAYKAEYRRRYQKWLSGAE